MTQGKCSLPIQNHYQYYRPQIEKATREKIRDHQWQSLRRLLKIVGEQNAFYLEKWRHAGVQDWRDITSLDDFICLPFTTRNELAADQEAHPPYGSNLSQPPHALTHWYRTSGSKGNPLKVIYADQDWACSGETWCYNFAGVGLNPGDSLYIAFSFGPFAGLWGAVGGALAYNLLMIPGGGQRTLDRIHTILDTKPTAVVCIPTYALRMAETAKEHGIDLTASDVRILIHGGEPGPSIPATRARIEGAWGAKSFDSTGQTEVGHYGFECVEQDGVHIIESSFFIEVFEPGTGKSVPEGEIGELVITALNRTGMPIIRYRTRDLVRLTSERCGCGRNFTRLLGGILSREDDMVTVRGVNIFPTAIENCLLDLPEISEYRVDVYEQRGMREIKVTVETAEASLLADDGQTFAVRVQQALRQRLTLRAQIEVVPLGSLPRSPGKAVRFVRHF